MEKNTEVSLKRTARRKVGGEGNKVSEKTWMTDEIRDGIKKRKELKRKKMEKLKRKMNN